MTDVSSDQRWWNAHGVPWPSLAAWVLLPFVLGPTFGASLATHSDPFPRIVSIGLWAIWVLGLLALAVPRPVTLTVARIVVPGSVVAGLWASVGLESIGTLTIVGLAVAVCGAIAIMLPGIADLFVDGASYGAERRFALRVPAPMLIAAVLPAWALTVIGVGAGPLLLADQRWIPGVIATIVGFAVVWVTFRSLYQMARRWLVLVPAGLVIHDSFTLNEPVLFTTADIAALGPAAASSNATDLTANALGLALSISMRRPIEVALVTGRGTAEVAVVEAVLVSPSRPGTVMAAAAAAGIAIG